jgi:hypothetical protein
MIGAPSGARIWLACGATDMRKGFSMICAAIGQLQLAEDPFSGRLFEHGSSVLPLTSTTSFRFLQFY